jgi:glutamate/tyrosine decarboxylase-like PLP-dependent enzyme
MHLPEEGQPWPAIEATLESYRGGDYRWREGRLPYFVWCAETSILEVQRKAWQLYDVENALGAKRAFPSLDRLEREVVEMALGYLGGTAKSGGSLTSGGTESNFLALKAARTRARQRRPGIGQMNVVVPETAHPSFRKAADILDLDVRLVPYDREHRSDVAAMAAATDEGTVLLLGSAPNFPTGTFDRIGELGQLALQRELWLHVDACVGGPLAPFARRLGHAVIDFDLAVPGVTTLSADLHKYGYAAKGASLILYRDAADLAFQEFNVEWASGTYSTPSFLGTRPGGAIAAAWAVMRSLGDAGYLERARIVLDTVKRLQAGIEAIPGLQVVRPCDLCILLYGSVDPALDINAVAEALGRRWTGCERDPGYCGVIEERLSDAGHLRRIAEGELEAEAKTRRDKLR